MDSINEFNKQLQQTYLSNKSIHPSWYENIINFKLSYQAPYLWTETLNYLDKRAIPGVEVVYNNQYYRTVRFKKTNSKTMTKGWLYVKEDSKRQVLVVSISASLVPSLYEVIHKLRHLFDLDINPDIIYDYLDPNWTTKGLRVPGAFDGFELSVRAILGQQITVKAATTLSGRLVDALGIPFNTKIDGLNKLFPLPDTFVNLSKGPLPIADILGPLGITGRRSNTIAALAEAVVSGYVLLNPIVTGTTINQFINRHSTNIQIEQAEIEMQHLLSIKGIGNWTAQYIGMRALGYPDSFLETDIGIKNAMPKYETPKKRLEAAEKWRPLRSYATVNLWNTLK